MQCVCVCGGGTVKATERHLGLRENSQEYTAFYNSQYFLCTFLSHSYTSVYIPLYLVWRK